MEKLNKTQQKLFEHALDNLYDFLKNMYKIDYNGDIKCMVCEGVIRVNQCSFPKGVAWFADIILDDKKIYVSTRKAELETIYSERIYDLIYMSNEPEIHTIDF